MNGEIVSGDRTAPEQEGEHWVLTSAGREHRVEIRRGRLRREVVWSIDGVEAARDRSMDDRFRLTTDRDLVVVRLPSFVGPARRVTLFEVTDEQDEQESARARLGLGDGMDFIPEPGSRAAQREQWITEHPRQYQALTVGTAIGKVVAPILLVLLFGSLVFAIPWPDWNLPSIPLPSIPWPSIPWPSIPWPDWSLPGWVELILDNAKYVVPVLVAWALASGEIRRRRRQDALRRDGEESSKERRTEGAAADPALGTRPGTHPQPHPGRGRETASDPETDAGTPAPGARNPQDSADDRS